MSLQDQVISFELAQQLHAAGVPQGSVWTYDITGSHPHWGNTGPHYAAFTMDELLEILGERFWCLERCYKFLDGSYLAKSLTPRVQTIGAETPQEALGRLLLVLSRPVDTEGAMTHARQ
jgi:hypothetical protein